jgi:hypothetical protein
MQKNLLCIIKEWVGHRAIMEVTKRELPVMLLNGKGLHHKTYSWGNINELLIMNTKQGENLTCNKMNTEMLLCFHLFLIAMRFKQITTEIRIQYHPHLAPISLWTTYYTVFWFTTTLDTPLKLAVNKQWGYTGFWLYTVQVSKFTHRLWRSEAWG